MSLAGSILISPERMTFFHSIGLRGWPRGGGHGAPGLGGPSCDASARGRFRVDAGGACHRLADARVPQPVDGGHAGGSWSGTPRGRRCGRGSSPSSGGAGPRCRPSAARVRPCVTRVRRWSFAARGLHRGGVCGGGHWRAPGLRVVDIHVAGRRGPGGSWWRYAGCLNGSFPLPNR